MLKFIHFHHFIHKTKLKIHVDYTTKCLPTMHPKERYALHHHLLHRYWQRGPLRQPSIQDEVAPITPSLRGAEITQDSACNVATGMSTCGQGAYIYKFSCPPFIGATRSSSIWFIWENAFMPSDKKISHRLLVDTFSGNGKHLCFNP